MSTIDAIREYGAAVDEGLARCMNNEAFYIRLANMAVDDAGYGNLKAAIEAGDLTAAFEAAHGLKGILGNLALTPMYSVVSDMTEELRAGTEKDYGPELEKLFSLREELRALL